MNYAEFYTKATEELNSTFLALHGRGDVSFHDHLEDMLKHEPLLREPIFQTIFPWEQYQNSFGSLSNMLGPDFINALDNAHFTDPLDKKAPTEDMSFPKTRPPYDHQYRAWEAAIQRNKSLLVTTGTGSGKTECFLVPILKDLYECRINNPNIGIQALFLYPLNALISSQRKRIHAWCNALSPKISYCIYTGELKDSKSQKDRVAAYPQLIDRKTLRETPPQILLTNPTMLEYMMVRSTDQALSVNNDLRWIVLDEAHSYNGTSAAELALQIRRIIKFFGKEPKDIKFAITSATIGSTPAQKQQMHNFIEELTGKIWNDFEEINGNRIVEEINYNHPDTVSAIGEINQNYDSKLTQHSLEKLRQDINTHPSISLNHIAEVAGISDKLPANKKLELVDALSSVSRLNPAKLKDGRSTALLPTRAHFYVRSVDGVYACTNTACTTQRKYRPISLAHHLTTYKSIQCESCKGEMLEVVKCPQCGELLLRAARIPAPVPGNNDLYFMSEVEVDEDSIFDFSTPQQLPSRIMLLDKSSRVTIPPLPLQIARGQYMNLNCMTWEIEENPNTKDYISYIKGANSICPKCGEAGGEMRPLNLEPILIQNHLSHILLNQSEATKTTDENISYEGRKYISFTDNRQKTAATARSQNIDVERNWIRGAIYYAVSNETSPQKTAEIKALIQALRNTNDPLLNTLIQQKEQELNAARTLSAQETQSKYGGDKEIIKLKKRFRDYIVGRTNDYLQALIVDQMATRSLRSALSLETLGLIHWEYPDIETIDSAPRSFVHYFGYPGEQDPTAVAEWKNLLKYLIDVSIRNNRHIAVPERVQDFLPHDFYVGPIFFQSTNTESSNLWPNLDLSKNNTPDQRRELVMLLLANGITDITNISPSTVQAVNDVLKDAWDKLVRLDILTLFNSGGNQNQGFILDFLKDNPKMKLALQTEGVLCPVTKQVLDYTFRGISPTIKGDVCQETLDRYKVTDSFFTIPTPDFTRLDYTDNYGKFDSTQWKIRVGNWITDTYAPAVEPHYGDINTQKSILLFDDVCIAKEHSAQLESDILRESEKQFINGEINILDCSTTMEMGVDIGSLSVVTMNNVPPKPQNYQQRVGRAGRRGEQKAMSLTIYGDNPIGREVEKNPSWALDHDIEASSMSLNSENIVRRHINSILLGQYLSTLTITLNEKIGDFIMGETFNNRKIKSQYSYAGYYAFLQNLKHLGDSNVESLCNYVAKGTCLMGLGLNDHIDSTISQITDIYNTVKKYIDNFDNEITLAPNKKVEARLLFNQKNLWNQNLLSYLGQMNYIPNAYMPTNVAELEINHQRWNNNTNPQREASLAIREYAPGRKITVDEMVYTSEGIRMQEENGAPVLMNIAKCNCGFVTMSPTIQHTACPVCGGKLDPLLGQTGNHSECISPLSYIAGEPHRSRDQKTQATNCVIPVLLNSDGWSQAAAAQCYALNTSSDDSTILYINKGDGFGYALCTCGRMEPEHSIQNDGSRNLPGSLGKQQHTKPGTNRICNNRSIIRNVLLYSENKTDLTEILINSHRQLQPNEETQLLMSLGTVISRKYAEMIGIEDSEIDFGRSGINSIFIFDTHSGGSSYSDKLASQVLFEKVLDQCRSFLSKCNCDRACTHCLVDRRSQYHLDSLNRNLALEWLDWEYQMRNIVPDSLKKLFPGASISKLFSTIHCAVGLEIRQCNFTNAKYFYDSHPTSSTDLFNLIKSDILYSISVRGKNVTCIIDKNCLNRVSLQTICDLQSITSHMSIQSCQWSQITGIYPILLTDDRLFVGYEENGLMQYFVISNFSNQFQITDAAPFNPSDYIEGRHANSVCLTESIKTNQYFEKILKYDLNNLDNFMADKNGNSVNIEYTDRYINTPSCCILLCDVIKQVIERYGLSISKIRINTTNAVYGGVSNNKLDDDFTDPQTRDTYLSQCVSKVLKCAVNIPSTTTYLPHDRLLRIVDTNGNFYIEIAPGGGFAQGWKLDVRDSNGFLVAADNSHQPDEVFEMYNTFSSRKNTRKDWGIRFSYAWR